MTYCVTEGASEGLLDVLRSVPELSRVALKFVVRVPAADASARASEIPRSASALLSET